MDKKEIIHTVEKKVKAVLSADSSGHDWWHIARVRNNALTIGTRENADLFVVEVAALLHDIADWKLHDGDENIGPSTARTLLKELKVTPEICNHVADIIATLSFKGEGVSDEMKTLEGQVVQDADRLDAIGAIGIARTFAYGGYKRRAIYDPNQKPIQNQSKEEFLKANGTTINHFHEKLLLLKNRMKTPAGKALASERHHFMEEYLDRFHKEWDGVL
jgi:uncharacterized protein